MLDNGVFRYTYRHDVAAGVETRMWLSLRLRHYVLALAALGTLVLLLGVLLHSWVVIGIAVVVIAEAWGVYVLKRHRAGQRYRAMHTPDASIAFAPAGVWYREIGESSYPWSFFTGWTVRRGAVILVRQVRTDAVFIRLPVDSVPDDEWQPLTTLVWEQLGPAGTPDSIRRFGSVRVRQPPTSGAAQTLRP